MHAVIGKSPDSTSHTLALFSPLAHSWTMGEPWEAGEGRQKAASGVGVQSGQIRRFGGCQAHFVSRPPSARRCRRRRQRDGLYCTSIVKVAMGMVGICYIHGKICYGHVMGMLIWACYGHVMGMVKFYYGHACDMPAPCCARAQNHA